MSIGQLAVHFADAAVRHDWVRFAAAMVLGSVLVSRVGWASPGGLALFLSVEKENEALPAIRRGIT